MKMRWEIHRSCIHPSKNLFQSLFLAANREVVVSLSILGITLNLDPLYDVLVEPLGYDALLLEYHGTTPQRLPRKLFQPAGQLRAIPTSLIGLNPHPRGRVAGYFPVSAV